MSPCTTSPREAPIAKVAAQSRDNRAGTCWLAVASSLFGEEVADVLGPDHCDVDGVIAEAPDQQPAHDAQCQSPGRRGKAAHTLHVLTVAAQFVIYRCLAHDRWGDHTLSAQNDQQMPQSSAQTGPMALNCAGAAAARNVTVQELRED